MSGINSSKKQWQLLVEKINHLEFRYRTTPHQALADLLHRRLDEFFGFALPACRRWLRNTKVRHSNDPLTHKLEKIINDAGMALTLDEKLISMNQLVNAHHNTNEFGQAVNEIYDGEHPLLH